MVFLLIPFVPRFKLKLFPLIIGKGGGSCVSQQFIERFVQASIMFRSQFLKFAVVMSAQRKDAQTSLFR
jgi:hypothetical protein